MDTNVTVAGNLTADPVARVTASGATVISFRVASSTRRFDRETQDWKDGDPMFITVTCWRQLGLNVNASLRKGDSVVVHGRLTYRQYDDNQGNKRTVHEIEAMVVGPDLARWPVEVRRPQRPLTAESADPASEAAPEAAADSQSQEPQPAAA